MDSYCRYCGEKLESGKFCPSCGAPITDPGTPQETTEEKSYENFQPQSPIYEQKPKGEDKSGLLIALSILISLTAIAITVIGVVIITFGNDIVTELIKSPEWTEIVNTYKGTFTEKELENAVRGSIGVVGALFAVPGIMGIIAGVLGFMKKGYVYGLIVCIIYTIASTLTFIVTFAYLFTIIMPIIGIVVTILWTKTKYTFE